GAGTDHAPHVAVVDQVLQHLAEDVAYARGVLEVHVKVVDKQQEHTPRRIISRTTHRKDDAFLHRRGWWGQRVVRAAAVDQHHRRKLLLDVVFEDLEISWLQIGDELIRLRITDDHVGRDQLRGRS